MCKVLIKEVKRVHAPKSGSTNEKAWKLFIFECAVQVDGSEVVVRTLKTFEESIATSIGNLADGASLVFDAKKEGDKSPCTYMIQKPKKKGGGFRREALGTSDRQMALRYAVELERVQASHCDEVPSPETILVTADKFLMWLEAG